MSDILVCIKRAILAGRYAFSEKASLEMEADGLTELGVIERIANAVAIYKTIRTTSLYVHAGESTYTLFKAPVWKV